MVDTRFPKPGRQSIKLSVLAVGIMACIGGRLILPPLLPSIIDDLNISSSLAGMALSLSWGLYAVMHYPGGVSSDQLTSKTTILVSLVTLSVGALVMLVTGGFGGLLLGVSMLGIGAGLYLPATYALSSELFPDRVGSALGVLSSSINVGGTLVPGIAFVAISTFTWQSAFVPLLVVYLLTIVLAHRLFDEVYVVSRVEFDVRATISRLVSSSRTRWTLVSIALLSVAWQGFISFLPLFLQAEKGVSSTTATLLYTSVFVIGALINPVSGLFSDRVGRKTVITGMITIGVVGLGVLVTAPTTLLTLVGVLVAAVGLTGVWPVVNAYVLGLFPDSTYAGDFGAARTVFLGVGSLGPTAVGSLAHLTSYATAYAVLIGCLCLSLISVFAKLEV
ncbi:MAG: MFS transporter [Halobacteriota archaeon]